jgi:hypothetical protein
MTNDFIDDAIDCLNKDGRQYILITMDDTGTRTTMFIHYDQKEAVKDFLLEEGFEYILDMLDEVD